MSEDTTDAPDEGTDGDDTDGGEGEGTESS
jgi:hypothetical protein